MHVNAEEKPKGTSFTGGCMDLDIVTSRKCLLLLLIGHGRSACSSSVHRTIGVTVHSVDLGEFARTSYELHNQLSAMFRILTPFSNGSTEGNTEK